MEFDFDFIQVFLRYSEDFNVKAENLDRVGVIGFCLKIPFRDD